MQKKYDLIIIGSGPAGLTAGIYAARYNLEFLIIGKLYGGAISEAHKVCNYPSQNNITGFKLTQEIVKHVKELKGEIKQETVIEINKKQNEFIITTNKNQYLSRKIILAIGREKEKLNIPGEQEFLGKGVSYCATCDASFYKDKTVAVVGGGNAAITSSLLLKEYAKKIFIIYKGDKFFKAEPEWVKQIKKEPKIKPLFNVIINEIYGEKFVQGILLKDGKRISLQGVFIEIGFKPHEGLSNSLGIKTEKGYIITDKNQKTNIKGVFAAGDVTNNDLKQVITAAAEGAIASTTAYEELMLED